METIIGTSLIAAFIAGIAALFAPCCVTVLLPSYFGLIFRTRRKVFLMTFIFFLGILTVFLPLGLGLSMLGQFFSHYHRTIFTAIGVALLILGISLLFGKRFPMPKYFRFKPELTGSENAGSIYLLGIFSGIATTCCAPVLAGALALSILPGSFIWGIIYTLAYVLGMVLPLFILAAALYTKRPTDRLFGMRKPIEFVFLGKGVRVRISDLLAGATFTTMGILTLYWASMNQVAVHSMLQVDINIYLTEVNNYLNRFIGWMPQYAWAIIFVGLFVYLVALAIKQFKKNQ
ncbi:MAG: cytochrome c biogenesis CcdA family protein [Patescibacteria group bacterium]|nr:cytochrome c biogenesis CcdA family protein [Patescibacteria group bacterium]